MRFFFIGNNTSGKGNSIQSTGAFSSNEHPHGVQASYNQGDIGMSPSSFFDNGRLYRMKKYKLESLIYYTNLFKEKEHILTTSSKDIQDKLDTYAADGWRLVSTDATDFGMAVYIYLYFEKDA